MVDISAETWNKAEISVIKIHKNDDINKTLLKLLCISDVTKRWYGKNIYDLIDKEINGKYKVTNINKIDRERLFIVSKHSMYVHEDIAITIMIQSRLLDPETIKFRADLGFSQINLILKKEQSVVILLLKTFSAQK